MTTSFLLGSIAGFVMHRSDFCMAGAMRDIFLFGSTAMLRPLLLLVVASMVLFAAARCLDLIAVYPFPLFASPSLANAVGGFFFGIGMVLAGGCVVGLLYKAGSGSLLALPGLLGLLVGSGLYAEIHPWWSALAKKAMLPPGLVTLPGLFGVSSSWWVVPLVLFAACLFWRWHRQGRWRRRAFATGYLQPWLAALVLAAVGLASVLLVGMPLGVTTAYAKSAAWVEALVWPERVAGLAFYAARPLDYVAPLGGTHLVGGAAPGFDGIAVVQFPLIVGIVFGAALSAARLRELRPVGKIIPRQAAAAVVGGAVMGLASRMTPGCNIWHLWGGLPILAMQSLLFVAGLLPGTWVGSRLLLRYVLADGGNGAEYATHSGKRR